MAKILLTGSLGFVGLNLQKKLENSGFNVTGYDILDGKLHDITDKFALEHVFMNGNFDIVIHLAARTGTLTSGEFPENYISTNINGTNNLLNLCKKYKVDKFIFFSSSSVFGGNNKKAIKEDEYICPRTLYGVTKAAGELLVKASGLDYIIIRPFTVYGPKGRREMVIYKWADQINAGKPITLYGDGTSSRGYTWLDDLTDAVVVAVKRMNISEKVNLTVNLGGSEVIKISELLEMFMSFVEDHCPGVGKRISYVKVPSLPDDIEHSYADTEFAKILFGFNPEADKFEERLRKILECELRDMKSIRTLA